MDKEKYDNLIKAAKAVPIDAVLEFFDWECQHNVVRCVSEDHPDMHPSAYLNRKTNNIFCPVCKYNADTISTYQMLSMKVKHESVQFLDACYKVVELGDAELPPTAPSLKAKSKEDMLMSAPTCDEKVHSYLEISHDLVKADYKYLASRGITLAGNLRNALIQNGITLRSLRFMDSWCTSFYFSYADDDFAPAGQTDFFFCRDREGSGKYCIGSPNYKVLYKHVEEDWDFGLVIICEGIFDALSILSCCNYPPLGNVPAVICLNSCTNAGRLVAGLEGALSCLVNADVVLALDNDDKGKKTAGQLEQALTEIGSYVSIFDDYGDCNDLNELYLDVGRDEFRKRLKLIDEFA